MPLIAKDDKAMDRVLRSMALVRANLDQIIEIKQAIESDDYVYGSQLWFEFNEYERNTLFLAPSKGGIFTTPEREAIRRFRL